MLYACRSSHCLRIVCAVGALIIADNADESQNYLARVRTAANGYLSTPFADDVELSMRLGMAVP